MKVLDRGHQYELAHLDGEGTQVLTFVKREGEHYPGNVGHHQGTTMQEVIRALLERARYVNWQIPCLETEAAIHCLQQALLLFEVRAKRVKGKHLDVSTLALLEACSTCDTCGHVRCTEPGHEARQFDIYGGMK
jgi:hypothetical protein